MAILWGAIYAVFNFNKYRKGKITKRQAVRDTASESVGIGVSTGVALAVAEATALAVTGSALVPFLVGTTVAGGTKKLWDRAFRLKRPITLKCAQPVTVPDEAPATE